jgi:hypothetical protein
MTKAQHSARRLRRLILIAGLVYTLAALCWLVTPHFNKILFDDFVGAGLLGIPLGVPVPGDERWYAIQIALFLGLLLLAQWAFLRPGRIFTARLSAQGRPLKSAVIAAAAMAMLLTVGLIALLLELPDWWEPIIDPNNPTVPVGVWAVMFLLWGLWACVFFVYWRGGDRYTRLGRMIRGLVAGSFAEVLVAIPVHVWATRQRECYCFRGTYTTLVFAGIVLLWAFGPGIVLLYMHERYRRARLFPMCVRCGYDLRGSSEACPECGTPIPQGTL